MENLAAQEYHHLMNYINQQTGTNNVELQCLLENRQENLYTMVKQLGAVDGCDPYKYLSTLRGSLDRCSSGSRPPYNCCYQ